MKRALLTVCLALSFMPLSNLVAESSQMAVVDLQTCHRMQNPTKPFVLVLKKGEPIIDGILECVELMGIKSASITGIGAIRNPSIAYYDLHSKFYKAHEFIGLFELTSLIGTVTTNPKGAKAAHLHVVFCNRSFKAYGGHLMSGDVGITVEITIIPFSEEIQRESDPAIGLDLMAPK